jgi:hypothetical protein
MFRLLRRNASIVMASVWTVSLTPGWGGAQVVAEAVPKQVDLIVDGGWLLASNVRLSRFDELKLNAQESIVDTSVGKAVIVVVTNQRLIAYGARSGWRTVPRIANERIERISAEDFAGLVVTSKRWLNFNGRSGVWGEEKRRVN